MHHGPLALLGALATHDVRARSEVALGVVALIGAAALGMGLVIGAAAARGRLAKEVLPGTSSARLAQLSSAAGTLAQRTLPSVLAALNATTPGQPQNVPPAELTYTEAAIESLKSLSDPPGHLSELAGSLGQIARQAVSLAGAVDDVASLSHRKLEEMVEARTSAIAHANRAIIGASWQRRQLFDRTVRVAESERAQLAADLHDGPIQQLAALGLVLDRCKLRLDRGDQQEAVQLLERARSKLADEIRHLRRMMSDLRPPVLDEGGLESALADQLASWSQLTGIETLFDATRHSSLSTDNETVAYRVVQEALANVAKHAKAGLVTVSLSLADDGTVLVVRDDGKGFRPLSEPDLLRNGHFGLALMRERVELAGGRFEIRSAPLRGTKIRAWLPAPETTLPDRPLPVGVAGLAP
ncbi:MAG: sensor histidine kinase [Acidimicrobiales bacterium]